jgi:hypothetical protein
VQLHIDELTVQIHGDAAGGYRFQCPGCRETVSRTASRRIVDLLLDAGAPSEHWEWPAELTERPDGPPLTPDDLLDLHVLLAREDWFEQLTALVHPNTAE